MLAPYSHNSLCHEVMHPSVDFVLYYISEILSFQKMSSDILYVIL